MKFKAKVILLSLSLVAISSVAAQGINPEIVRLNNLAGQRLAAGDWNSAERDCLHALDIAVKSEAGSAVATLHQNLGTVYADENRREEAEQQYWLAYDILKATYGEESPKVALALDTIGEMTCFRGRFQAASSLFQRALDILQSQTNSSGSDVATVLTNLAGAQWLLGNLSKASTILDRSTALFERAGDPQNPTFTLALQLHARMWEQAGDLPRAEADCRQALWLLEGSGNTRNLARGLATMGYLLLRQNKLPEAQANLERGLQFIKASGTEDVVAAGLMSNLAECYHMQGRSQEAGPLFERAIAIDRRSLSSDHPNLLGVMQQYAVYLRATKRKAEAKRIEAYVKTHSAENKRLNATVNVIDVRQLLLEQNAR